VLRLALPPEASDDGVTVAEAARMLGADPTTVRELLHCGELEGWKVGKRRNGQAPTGIRVSRESCLEYRQRHRVRRPLRRPPIDNPQESPKPRQCRTSAAHLEALASLRARGVRV
jgi:excisionase family DNA binding protein